MFEAFEEFLIGIKYVVDNKTVKETETVMGKVEKTIEKFAKNSNVQFGLAAFAYISFVGVVTQQSAKLIGELARTDMAMQVMARRMFTSVPNIYSLRTTMKAMGLKSLEELQDVSMNPELRGRYMALRKQAFSMMPPSAYSEQLKQIRDIQFEFMRMNLEGSYTFQRIGFYLMKNLEAPLKEVQKILHSLNDSFTKNMPAISKTVGGVFSYFINQVVVIAKVVGGIFNIFGKLFEIFNKMPSAIKNIGLAVIALDLILKVRFGWLLALLQSVYLLLDDIFTYYEGGKSLMGGIYSRIYDRDSHKSGGVEAIKGIPSAIGGYLGASNSAAITNENARKLMKNDLNTAKNLNFTHRYIENMKRAYGGNVNITSITGGRHGRGSGHYLGQKFDIGLKGVSLEEKVRMYEAMIMTSGLQHINYETPNRAEYNQFFKELKRRHLDTSKLGYYWGKNSSGSHFDVKTNQNVNIYIQGDNAKKIGDEVQKRITAISMRHLQGVQA